MPTVAPETGLFTSSLIEPHATVHAPAVWFDRSSIAAQAMVTIQGVAEADWWEHAPEGSICEYIDGIVYMPPPASDEHQDEVSFLSFLLQGFTTEKELGKTRCGPAALKLGPGRNPEPDIFVVPPGPGPHSPPALIVVEVLSPTTRAHDLGLKADVYREAVIPEILYLDLARPRLIVHSRYDDLYLTRIVSEGTWVSSAVPGFWIDVAWLFGPDRPKATTCLQRILFGLPS